MNTENTKQPDATAEACDQGRCAVASGSADFVQENHYKLCALAAALKHLVEVIEAHEIESLSCDRDGNEYCDCLRNAATEAKRLLPNTADDLRPPLPGVQTSKTAKGGR